jgi:hypothetical protein
VGGGDGDGGGKRIGRDGNLCKWRFALRGKQVDLEIVSKYSLAHSLAIGRERARATVNGEGKKSR